MKLSPWRTLCLLGSLWDRQRTGLFKVKSLIMAQIERWRQVSYMQVERERSLGTE